MKHDKLLSMLGICRKAGRLIFGADAVSESIHKGEAHIVLLTHDLSRRSGEKIAAAAVHKSVKVLKIPLSMDEIGTVTGKASGIIAITDKGLADAVESRIGALDTDSPPCHKRPANEEGTI